ncbi:hypothetical protein JCM10207_000638 [Rhodosporidiobolus poonsookiae]
MKLLPLLPLLALLPLIFATLYRDLTAAPYRSLLRPDSTSRSLRNKFAGSGCVSFGPLESESDKDDTRTSVRNGQDQDEVVFHRAKFEKSVETRREWCYRQLYYNHTTTSLRLSHEISVAGTGTAKAVAAFEVDTDDTTFFYVALCYDDAVSSRFEALGFGEEAGKGASSLFSCGGCVGRD